MSGMKDRRAGECDGWTAGRGREEGMVGERTYRASVAWEVVDLLKLREDDGGFPFGLQTLPERRISKECGRERAAETTCDEEVCDRLDGILGGLIQCGSL